MNAFKHFVFEEWYFAVPMFLMSLTAIALVVWRFLLNMNAKTDMDEFLPIFQEKLQKEGVESALRLCREETGMIPRKLFASGLEASKQGISAMKRAMASTLELEILPDLNFLLAIILAIAKIATMVGLLGTVISMIGTFTAISGAKGGANPTDVTTQAGSIGLALFATALGLMTAIPLVFAHVLFKDWILRFETQMKANAQRLIVLFQNIKPKQGSPLPARESGKERERVKTV
jgi:biopolymer transport protein ExbB